MQMSLPMLLHPDQQEITRHRRHRTVRSVMPSQRPLDLNLLVGRDAERDLGKPDSELASVVSRCHASPSGSIGLLAYPVKALSAVFRGLLA